MILFNYLFYFKILKIILWYHGLLKHYIVFEIVSIIGIWNYLWIWYGNKSCVIAATYEHEVFAVYYTILFVCLDYNYWVVVNTCEICSLIYIMQVHGFYD